MKLFSFALSLFVFLAAAPLQAQMLIEEADPVPANISETDSKELAALKSDLDSEFEAISSDIQQYNALCSGSLANSMGCQGRYLALTGRMSTYQASLVRYRSAIRKATKQ